MRNFQKFFRSKKRPRERPVPRASALRGSTTTASVRSAVGISTARNRHCTRERGAVISSIVLVAYEGGATSAAGRAGSAATAQSLSQNGLFFR